jgi:hypothetical protein
VSRGLGTPVLLLGLALALACSSAPEGLSEDEAVATAEDFLADMEAGTWNAAFGRMHEGLQALREPRVRPSQALISGQVNTADGDDAIVELTLVPAGDAWTISFWSASNRELCLEGLGNG